jgi:hypothetical protein
MRALSLLASKVKRLDLAARARQKLCREAVIIRFIVYLMPTCEASDSSQSARSVD